MNLSRAFGGFILSSPLVLLILPSLYCWLDPHGRLAGRATPVTDTNGTASAGLR